MPNHQQRVKYDELKGSELHHDLKNDPGKKGDPNHAKDDVEDAKKSDAS